MIKEFCRETESCRIILLNGFPVSEFTALGRVVEFALENLSPSDFVEEIRKRLEDGYKISCYIRHQSTVNVLRELLNIKLESSAELYHYKPLDKIYIIVPKALAERGREIQISKPEDLYFIKLVVF